MRALAVACRLAAKMGGGNLRVPVQRVPDFLAGHLSVGTLPSSSYRSDSTPLAIVLQSHSVMQRAD